MEPTKAFESRVKPAIILLILCFRASVCEAVNNLYNRCGNYASDLSPNCGASNFSCKWDGSSGWMITAIDISRKACLFEKCRYGVMPEFVCSAESDDHETWIAYYKLECGAKDLVLLTQNDKLKDLDDINNTSSRERPFDYFVGNISYVNHSCGLGWPNTTNTSTKQPTTVEIMYQEGNTTNATTTKRLKTTTATNTVIPTSTKASTKTQSGQTTAETRGASSVHPAESSESAETKKQIVTFVGGVAVGSLVVGIGFLIFFIQRKQPSCCTWTLCLKGGSQEENAHAKARHNAAFKVDVGSLDCSTDEGVSNTYPRYYNHNIATASSAQSSNDGYCVIRFPNESPTAEEALHPQHHDTFARSCQTPIDNTYEICDEKAVFATDSRKLGFCIRGGCDVWSVSIHNDDGVCSDLDCGRNGRKTAGSDARGLHHCLNDDHKAQEQRHATDLAMHWMAHNLRDREMQLAFITFWKTQWSINNAMRLVSTTPLKNTQGLQNNAVRLMSTTP